MLSALIRDHRSSRNAVGCLLLYLHMCFEAERSFILPIPENIQNHSCVPRSFECISRCSSIYPFGQSRPLSRTSYCGCLNLLPKTLTRRLHWQCSCHGCIIIIVMLLFVHRTLFRQLYSAESTRTLTTTTTTACKTMTTYCLDNERTQSLLRSQSSHGIR